MSGFVKRVSAVVSVHNVEHSECIHHISRSHFLRPHKAPDIRDMSGCVVVVWRHINISTPHHGTAAITGPTMAHRTWACGVASSLALELDTKVCEDFTVTEGNQSAHPFMTFALVIQFYIYLPWVNACLA